MNFLRSLWPPATPQPAPTAETAAPAPLLPVGEALITLGNHIAADDPLLVRLQNQRQVNLLDVTSLTLESPLLQELRAAGVRLAVPLVSQGELLGFLNLGPRLSEQEYTSDDRQFLLDLATQAAPALRVAQLVQVQKEQARERERIEQELRVARLIQQTLLPRELPLLEGWEINTYYQPARAVGGDFYDFIAFPDGHMAVVIGDVTDKGVPAALVMATTRAVLRAAAEQFTTPSAVLERTNNVLVNEIPPKMFVTCLYALLNPRTGHLRYANAGHDVPYRRTAAGVQELRARGMPLGLLPQMAYEEKEVYLQAGDSILFYSDGLVEAHNGQREMFSFGRLKRLLATESSLPTAELIPHLLEQLADFTGADWEQEDDVTLVTLACHTVAAPPYVWEQVATFELPSMPGKEREAMNRIAELVGAWPLGEKLARLKTAVSETTMNAMEHANRYEPQQPVQFELLSATAALMVRITALGSGPPLTAAPPNLTAKLEGQQTPRGWGLFLIQQMVDEMRVVQEEERHTVELIVKLEPR